MKSTWIWTMVTTVVQQENAMIRVRRSWTSHQTEPTSINKPPPIPINYHSEKPETGLCVNILNVFIIADVCSVLALDSEELILNWK